MKIFTILLIALSLTACAKIREVQGTGSGRNDFDKSPCACGPDIAMPRKAV